MFGWAITFLVIALIAGLLGFGVVAGTPSPRQRSYSSSPWSRSSFRACSGSPDAAYRRTDPRAPSATVEIQPR
jgi:predicted MFS family arabinose efflux permease